MESRVYHNNIRISPRKVTIVLDLIRGKDVKTASGILKNTPKAACPYIIKLLDSAVANAENNFAMDPENLYVSECFVGQGIGGKSIRRMMPAGKGSGNIIHKYNSNITLAVKEIGKSDED